MRELKPCPFCGGEAEYHSDIDIQPVIGERGAYVDVDVSYFERCGCPKCDIWFESHYDDDSEEITIERWNRRANDERINN